MITSTTLTDLYREFKKASSTVAVVCRHEVVLLHLLVEHVRGLENAALFK